MPRWLRKVLARIHELAAAGRVSLTGKAVRELELLDLGLEEQDVRLILLDVQPRDFAERFVSEDQTEWLYVFKPRVAGIPLYVKVILRSTCVVVSFHEEETDEFPEEP